MAACKHALANNAVKSMARMGTHVVLGGFGLKFFGKHIVEGSPQPPLLGVRFVREGIRLDGSKPMMPCKVHVSARHARWLGVASYGATTLVHWYLDDRVGAVGKLHNTGNSQREGMLHTRSY